jgi:hypothetical protein
MTNQTPAAIEAATIANLSGLLAELVDGPEFNPQDAVDAIRLLRRATGQLTLRVAARTVSE